MLNSPEILPEEIMHPAYIEPEVKLRVRKKTGLWRYTRPIVEDKIAPCTNDCPAHEKIPDYVEMVKKGQFREAWELIREDNPMPAVSGRVCYHPCEAACNRETFDQGIAIHSIERFVGDYGLKLSLSRKRPAREEKIAIIGSGPAGLTCGYYLTRWGYRATIFEALPVAGGMLYTGIPEYRLPKEILLKEIEGIKQFGLEIRTNTPVGKDLNLDDLFKQGYKAILIATGSHKGQRLGVPGEDSDGVLQGVAFLRDLNLEKKPKVGGNIAVIGGGNVAIDAARCVLRLNSKVLILYRRTRDEMPASDEEIRAAVDEGIEIKYLVAPVEILTQNGKVTGMRCIRMELGDPDASGRRRPIPIGSSEFDLEVDMVILAIGQTPDLSFLIDGTGIEATDSGTLLVDTVTLSTTRREGVFAGGDVVTGPARVVDAIAAGKKAALMIDAFIAGTEPKLEKLHKVAEYKWLNTDYFKHEPRQEASKLLLAQRRISFAEVDQGPDNDMVIREATRCFYCGACDLCGNCWFFCPDMAIFEDSGHFKVDLDYCKGCGICATECPRGVILMEEEAKWQY